MTYTCVCGRPGPTDWCDVPSPNRPVCAAEAPGDDDHPPVTAVRTQDPGPRESHAQYDQSTMRCHEFNLSIIVIHLDSYTFNTGDGKALLGVVQGCAGTKHVRKLHVNCDQS